MCKGFHLPHGMWNGFYMPHGMWNAFNLAYDVCNREIGKLGVTGIWTLAPKLQAQPLTNWTTEPYWTLRYKMILSKSVMGLGISSWPREHSLRSSPRLQSLVNPFTPIPSFWLCPNYSSRESSNLEGWFQITNNRWRGAATCIRSYKSQDPKISVRETWSCIYLNRAEGVL